MKSEILVYKDLGVGPMSRAHTARCLKELVCQNSHLVRETNSHELILGNWHRNASLLVMPGGADVYYHKLLAGDGNRKIQKFVEHGGCYLGLCAGAYYACKSFEFDKGGELEICATRELEFFPGKAIGPAYGVGSYKYDSQAGARISKLKLTASENELGIYSNGAPYFETTNDSDTNVIAYYQDVPNTPPAIISTKIFKGLAILCGPYPVFSPDCFDSNDPFMKTIWSELLANELNRIQLMQQILKNFGIKINEKVMQ